MPAELNLPAATIMAFLLVATRVGSALVFVPIPGVRKAAAPARVVMILALSMLLYPHWPRLASPPSMGQMAGWLAAEAAIGTLAGVLVGFIVESFQVAAQVVGLQAGFAWASMVDPQTQADSGVLLVFAQLGGGLIFFALGLDREVIRVFARSLETLPPGGALPPAPAVEAVVRLGSGLFTTAVRLALPVLALVALVDISLALIGRLNAQLQLLTLAFPLKMLVAVLMLAWLMPVYSSVLGAYSGQVITGLAAALGRR